MIGSLRFCVFGIDILHSCEDILMLDPGKSDRTAQFLRGASSQGTAQSYDDYSRGVGKMNTTNASICYVMRMKLNCLAVG